MTRMSIDLYRTLVLRQLAACDQDAAGWHALIVQAQEALSLTGVGGPWDEVNARIARLLDIARGRLAAAEELAASYLELLPQLAALETRTRGQ